MNFKLVIASYIYLSLKCLLSLFHFSNMDSLGCEIAKSYRIQSTSGESFVDKPNLNYKVVYAKIQKSATCEMIV